MKNLCTIIACCISVKADPLFKIDLPPYNNSNELPSSLPTRRIMRGKVVGETRPYMVYLRPATGVNSEAIESHWLCGGVILSERYILTSAACIEDVKQFYVISGTHTWVPPEITDNECINNGAKKATWKCVPKSYFFDGNEFDNIRWMVGDIAIVKVEDDFNFERRIRGCDFIPKKIAYNNRSIEYEKGGSVGTIAGWGTYDQFINIDKYPLRSSENSPELLETDVLLISKKHCKKRWEERYHFIIDDEMICTKDISDGGLLSSACTERDVSCKKLDYSNEDYVNEAAPSHMEHDLAARSRRMMVDPSDLFVHTAGHRNPTRRTKIESGGFCENDHGGPLIIGQGQSAIVVGVMSACLTQDVSKKCYGPFLYTSVFKYRNLIACAITRDIDVTCRKLMTAEHTPIKQSVFDWRSHPDGPPKYDKYEKIIMRKEKSRQKHDNKSKHEPSIKKVSTTSKKTYHRKETRVKQTSSTTSETREHYKSEPNSLESHPSEPDPTESARLRLLSKEPLENTIHTESSTRPFIQPREDRDGLKAIKSSVIKSLYNKRN